MLRNSVRLSAQQEEEAKRRAAAKKAKHAKLTAELAISRMQRRAKEDAEAEAKAATVGSGALRPPFAVDDQEAAAEAAARAAREARRRGRASSIAKAAKVEKHRSRQAARMRTVQEKALAEAAAHERAQAVLRAKEERFRYPELKHLAEAMGVSGRTVKAGETDWLMLLRAICDEIQISIMQVAAVVAAMPAVVPATVPAAFKLLGSKRPHCKTRSICG